MTLDHTVFLFRMSTHIYTNCVKVALNTMGWILFKNSLVWVSVTLFAV